MWAMDLLPEEALMDGFTGATLGLECSGRVAAVGEGVTGLAVGDEVVAIAPFSFGAYALADARFVAHKPERITFEEAATLPIAFLTAVYTLDYLGRLGRGEKAL